MRSSMLWIGRFGLNFGPWIDMPTYVPRWWRIVELGPIQLVDSGKWSWRLRLDR